MQVDRFIDSQEAAGGTGSSLHKGTLCSFCPIVICHYSTILTPGNGHCMMGMSGSFSLPCTFTNPSAQSRCGNATSAQSSPSSYPPQPPPSLAMAITHLFYILGVFGILLHEGYPTAVTFDVDFDCSFSLRIIHHGSIQVFCIRTLWCLYH